VSVDHIITSVSHVTPSNAEPAFIGHLVGARRHRGREATTRGTPNGRHARRADRRVGTSRGLWRGHADALAQRPDCRRPPSQGAGWVVRFDLGDGPTEAGKLAGNGDGDQGAAVSRRSIAAGGRGGSRSWVIDPSRRCSPVESSQGTKPRGRRPRNTTDLSAPGSCKLTRESPAGGRGPVITPYGWIYTNV
jgi:hypothetical protein